MTEREIKDRRRAAVDVSLDFILAQEAIQRSAVRPYMIIFVGVIMAITLLYWGFF